MLRFIGSLVLISLSVLGSLISKSAASSDAPSGKCSAPVRLDGPGGTMENVPVRDQSSLGICFAESAAEELSAVQRKLHIKNPVEPSAMAIAAGLSTQNGQNAFKHGGDPCEAISYAVKNGVCSVDEVENSNSDADGKLGQNLNQMISNGIQKEFSRLQPKYGSCEARSHLIPVTENQELIHSLLLESGDSLSTYKEVTKNCAKNPVKSATADPIKDMKLSCNRFPDEKEGNRKISPNEFEQKLNRLLDGSSPLPAMIGFCSSILTDHTKKGGAPASTDSCGGHAALVIGRRAVNGKCQFLLRNSWGTECDHYAPELQDQCEPGKGNVWVDAETLTKNTLEIIPPPL